MSSVRLIKGNREWIIKDTVSGYRVSYGVVGGKTQTKSRIVKPKSNRTFWQQVELEINSKINKQRDKGYHLPGEDPPAIIKPMLAHSYDVDRVDYPVSVQEKLNGIRCLALCDNHGNIELITRKGKPITSMGHIVKELGRFMSPGETWDGELFNRQYSLQEISGAVRRSESKGIATEMEYWIYDTIMPGTFKKRLAHLNAALCKPSMILRLVQTFTCPTESGIDLYYNSIIGQGGEGIMIRNPESQYQGKRTYDLMKRKGFKDEEFTIVGHKRDVDGCIIWTCVVEPTETSPGELDAWLEFDVVPNGAKERRLISDELVRQFCGEQLTVRYSDTSADGVPQGNPVGICIRNYE